MSDDAFEIGKVCYEQNCLQMRSLNQIMWQVPMIAMTLTGGLWFGASSSQNLDPAAKTLLFIFCALGDVAMIFVIQRVRSVMDAYLDQIKNFSPVNYADTKKLSHQGFLKERGVCNTFSLLMGCAAFLSAFAAVKSVCWG